MIVFFLISYFLTFEKKSDVEREIIGENIGKNEM
jgi:hypothetical protein